MLSWDIKTPDFQLQWAWVTSWTDNCGLVWQVGFSSQRIKKLYNTLRYLKESMLVKKRVGVIPNLHLSHNDDGIKVINVFCICWESQTPLLKNVIIFTKRIGTWPKNRIFNIDHRPLWSCSNQQWVLLNEAHWWHQSYQSTDNCYRQWC